jgi:hypothetical protein
LQLAFRTHYRWVNITIIYTIMPLA